MIEQLTSSSFKAYGDIYNKDFKEVCGAEEIENENIKQLNIATKSMKSLICTNNSISVLGLLEGLAILCISLTPSTEDIEVFLLDKTITINPGFFFNVVPLYGVCSIQIGKKRNEEIKEYFLSEEFAPLGIYPKVTINNVFTLFYQNKEKNFLFNGEKHNFWELTYIDKGTLYNNIDGKDYITKQGELIFFKKNQYHIQWTDEETPASFITITFDMDFDDSNALSNKIFSVDDEAKSILSNIMLEKQDDLYYCSDIIISYLKILIIRLIRSDKLEYTIHSLYGDVKTKVENSIISKTLQYIHGNINKKICISDIAKHVYLSQSYLSSIFKQNMNITIIDYINNYRLEKSKHLIKSNKYSMTQIAEMLGYTSIHYFSRQFKLHFGVSPTTYATSINNDSE